MPRRQNADFEQDSSMAGELLLRRLQDAQPIPEDAKRARAQQIAQILNARGKK